MSTLKIDIFFERTKIFLAVEVLYLLVCELNITIDNYQDGWLLLA